MGFLDELKKLTHPYDENDDDFFGSASDDEPAVEEEEARTSRRSGFFSDPDEAEPESVGIPSAREAENPNTQAGVAPPGRRRRRRRGKGTARRPGRSRERERKRPALCLRTHEV